MSTGTTTDPCGSDRLDESAADNDTDDRCVCGAPADGYGALRDGPVCADCASRATPRWRLQLSFGDLTLRSEWTSEWAVVENLADQLRCDDAASEVVIERLAEVDA
ncbi:uncharacterized protein NP_5366A [Natronomonas pharaonis DSM 2160]|uniref:Uncharacterized protein n=1 Tax=Natronomonas pharaonis (strain ATCC 35678 / DSM 2160 / CIP 103997 / JCM 8858 / NBRC 14720 / NCIMB 2260 / Gabara) TaxID=348780 RepID=A0A1U7EZQ0_NATPD|nr:hypothetical protein [Natronomonas pharaonis]CAI50774.1 uncharacterized protein NP_5366A [Natronomonas pharaonis DSM 2160]